MGLHSLTLRLAIPAEDFLRLYSGCARDVVAVADDGSTVRFPGNVLRTQVSHDGVYGRFRLTYDDSGRFRGLERLAA